MDSILFSSPTVSIGRFYCPLEHPSFEDSGPIQDHIFVVPSSSVRITHEGAGTVVADRNTVMFYNRGQAYRREPVSGRGDLCHWFHVRGELISEALRRFEGGSCPDRPFTFRRAPMSSKVFAETVRLVRTASEESPMAVEEGVMALLDEVIELRFREERVGSRSSRNRRQLDLVEAARELLAVGYWESWSLDEIATRLASSPFHLARVFRRETGRTLHAYRTELRLRASLERLADGVDDLSGMAHDLGFSSHSHFSDVFRRWAGESPSVARSRLAKPRAELCRSRRPRRARF